MPESERSRDTDWLGYLQPIGLVVAPRVLAQLGLTPPQQTAVDSEAYDELLPHNSDGSVKEDGPALTEPWALFEQVLGWPVDIVAGTPDGPKLPDELYLRLPESDTVLEPHWAVVKPDRSGCQLLVRLEGPGIEPDARGALPGWEATPHQRFERLLRETGVFTGALVTDDELRLIHAPRGETSGWLSFPLRQLGSVPGRPMLGGLKLLLDSRRLFTDAPTAQLPAVLKASREAQAEVSSQLATQVLGALHELLRGFHAADPAHITELARTRPARLYEGLLAVLLRLVFLLYAEDRDLIPSRTEPAARALYDQGYGVRTLHGLLLDDAARNPDTMDERRGGWGRLLALFRLVHGGETSGWIRARGGKLFDPAEFPFLEGRHAPDDPPRVPDVRDGIVLRVLDGLLTLGGERLSYRTLDVEQIGSVYETVMGFTVTVAAGPALAIAAGRKNKTPVFVDLKALAGEANRLRWLAENTDRGKFAPKVEAAIKAAKDEVGLAAALAPVVDERGSPRAQVAPPGTPLLQPTHERRRTGSHYTPRELTEPIVRHALELTFERLGNDATPEAVLALKVCDPAMGSGAFLVEACRQLAARLVQSWRRHPADRPAIPSDEDEELLAKRLVAQRCLYGVDKNPMAADLARLSLWLATLARDHEFTFLDHALKSGDSLVGLTRAQIGGLRWDAEPAQGSLFSGLVRERVAEALRRREEIRAAPDDMARAVQERRYAIMERPLAEARLIGDAIIAAFFAGAKPREREAHRRKLEDEAVRSTEAAWKAIRDLAPTLNHGPHPVHPFHWELEFPEVFAGDSPGFDTIVGNPPFAGKNTLAASNRENYPDWLQTVHEGAHGNSDLVAHFFRRAFGLIRRGGCFGLVATNTIGQGDTRESGLRWLVEHGGAILRGVRRFKWPGEAAVIVSIVHVLRGAARQPVLDGRQVRRISAYLVEGDLDGSPAPLAANAGKAYVGMFLLGLGFTFDDDAAAKGKASSVADMQHLINRDRRNAERIFPYLGGEEVNTSPKHMYRRWCIDFNDFPLQREPMSKTWDEMDESERARCRTLGIVPLDYSDPVASDWPDLIEVVRRRVKPERDPQKRKALQHRWWQYAEKRPGLRHAIARNRSVGLAVQTSPHVVFARVPTGYVYDVTLVVFPDDSDLSLTVLQARTHEVWVREFCATMKDDFRYRPSDGLVNFPFVSDPSDGGLPQLGSEYFEHRSALMIARNEGATKTYNRFHDPAERAADIQRLRELHHEMDCAVLRAYAWDDLADRAAPEFLTEEAEPDHRYQGRLFWPAAFRDEVLARLLALNTERAEQERRLGLAPTRKRTEEPELEEAG